MRRRGDRIPGRRRYGGVLLVPCLLHAAYRCWFLADTGAARTLITRDVALDLGLDLRPPVRQVRIASVHQVVSAPLVHLVSLQGRSVLICFADDGVIGCAMEADARRIMAVRPKRFARYGLTIHPTKTALMAGGKPAGPPGAPRGTGPSTFSD